MEPNESDTVYVNLSIGMSNGTANGDGLRHEYLASISDIVLEVLHQLVVPALFGAISLVGLVGNTLVICVIVSRRQMRTVVNLLLLNLAVADLSFAVVVPPVTAYHFAVAAWPFGDAICRLMHYSVNLTAYVTVYTLVLISVVRYMTVVRNAQTVKLRTRRNTIVAIATVWAIMVVVNIPIILSYGTKTRPTGLVECDHDGPEVARVIFASFFAFGYLLPLTVIGVLSLCVLRHIVRHRSSVLQDQGTRSTNRKRQAGRLIVLVVVVFALLWLPVHVHLLVAYFGSTPDDLAYQVLTVVIYCLAYFNSCVNPIIYNSTSKDFRTAFHEIVCCSRPEAIYRLTSATNQSHHNSTDRILLSVFKTTKARTNEV